MSIIGFVLFNGERVGEIMVDKFDRMFVFDTYIGRDDDELETWCHENQVEYELF